MNKVCKEETLVRGNASSSNPALLSVGQDCFADCAQNSSDEEELSAFLSLLDYDSHYRIDRTLKHSEAEVTQVVTFVAENGTEQGPFIRKRLMTEQGIGSAYTEIYQAQQQGCDFRHVPKIHALYQLKDELVVVMDYVRGETLQEVVYRKDPSPQLAIEVFPQICEAVREVHEGFSQPLIHRDLKPSNLILSWDTVTLIDFGIARMYRSGSDCDTARFGTREYAPPEQFGFGQTDVRSDIYALGMLLFYCLTERTAAAQDRAAYFACEGVPPEFQEVIARACSFDPDGRYTSVCELQNAFAKAAARMRAGEARSREEGRSVGREGEGMPDEGAFCRLRKTLMSIPQGVGIAWNVIVALFWLLVVAVSVNSCFWPNPELPEAGYPLWVRVVEYLLFMVPSITCICYEVSDRRRVRRRFPVLAKWPQVLEFVVVAIAAPFVLAMIMSFCCNAAAV